ncbi:MAG: type II secretion system protein GspG [Deltaproteobacteria bacterium]|nr:type II secretion system protein GspG [Deltaproteobacteria bacterium]
MIDAIVKLIPMITVAGGAAASSPNIKAQIAKVMEATKVVATQQEISDITKMVYLDTIDGSHPRSEDFSDYLRKNMRTTNNINRDTSLDQWGKAYTLTYNKRKREIVVTSAGPDQNYGNADDIRGVYPIDQFASL